MLNVHERCAPHTCARWCPFSSLFSFIFLGHFGVLALHSQSLTDVTYAVTRAERTMTASARTVAAVDTVNASASLLPHEKTDGPEFLRGECQITRVYCWPPPKGHTYPPSPSWQPTGAAWVTPAPEHVDDELQLVKVGTLLGHVYCNEEEPDAEQN